MPSWSRAARMRVGPVLRKIPAVLVWFVNGTLLDPEHASRTYFDYYFGPLLVTIHLETIFYFVLLDIFMKDI